MSARYSIASIPEPYTILGLTLEPFSIGHWLLMQRFGCDFQADQSVTLADPFALVSRLLLSLAICSMKHGEFIEAAKYDRMTAHYQDGTEWKTKTISFQDWKTRWIDEVIKASEADNALIFDAIALFKRYLKDGLKTPDVWNEKDSEPRESGTHWTEIVISTLMSELGYSREDVLNMPLSQAMADHYRILEKYGVVTVMTDEDLELARAQVGGKDE